MRYAIFIVCLLLIAQSGSAQQVAKYNIYLRSDAGTDTMYDGRIIRVYGMPHRLSETPHIPAKTIYCNEGDTLILHALSISQGDHHTIHLHGLDATTPNDGDPATSFYLSHMQDTDYVVVASHAGTYLYHCHFTDVIHVQMGMYGLVVVRPKNGEPSAWTGGPTFDKSYNWLFSEVDPFWHDSIPKHDPIADTIHVPSYKPAYFLINGKSESQLSKDDSIPISGQAGEKIYLRTGSIGFFYQRIIFPSWVKAKKIDSDGRPFEAAIESDTIEIAPGERYGIMLESTNSGNDVIKVEFINMNTDSVWSTQSIPIVFSQATVKTAEPDETEIVVRPNPAISIVAILGQRLNGSLADIECINSLGEVVVKTNGTLPVYMDVHSLPSGIYSVIVRIRDMRSANVFHKKVLLLK